MDKAKQVLDLLYSRRSCRSYVQGKPVPHSDVDLLLKAAMAAPSACNLQPWEFIVIEDAQQVEAVRAHVPGGQYPAPLVMVVCARTEYVPWGGNSWQIDCAAAIENMLTLATAMGLAGLWIGDYDEDALRALLDIPDGVEIVNVVYFGYPAEEKAAITRYKDEAVYWGKYDPARPHAPRTTQGMIAQSIRDSRIEDREVD